MVKRNVLDSLFVEHPSYLLDNANDMTAPGNPPIYDALLAVKPAELSLNAWTMKAGVSRSMFNEIRRHGNPTSDTLSKLLDAIGVTLAQFEAGATPVRTEVAGTGMSVGDVDRAWRGAPQSKPIPLLGSAIGGEWDGIDEAVELTELHLSEVLDYLARPPSVANDPEAYAVTIVGESMAPRYEPGERATVSPRSPASIGDDVVVQLRGDGHDRITMVLIKRLVRRTSKFIELRQFNPDMTFQIPLERVAATHRVRGRL